MTIEQQAATDTGEMTFRPRPTNGRVWVLGIGFGTLLLFVVPFLPVIREIPWPLIAAFAILGIVVAGPIILVGLYAARMEYVLTDAELRLRMPPMMDDRIALSDIVAIRRGDLKSSPLASFRFPGLAVFDVDYRDAGRVRMCATAASTDILVLETSTGRQFGLTPEEPQLLVDALQRASSRPIEFQDRRAGTAQRA